MAGNEPTLGNIAARFEQVQTVDQLDEAISALSKEERGILMKLRTEPTREKEKEANRLMGKRFVGILIERIKPE